MDEIGPPSARRIFTLSEADIAKLGDLRVAHAAPSEAAIVRKLIREADVPTQGDEPMHSFKLAGAQGEVNFRRVETIPEGLTPLAPEAGLLIVGHSESGHHHGFRPAPGVQVLEKTEGVRPGLRVLYAILENPTALIQDAGTPHAPVMFDPGVYRLTISREYDPFADEARRVAD